MEKTKTILIIGNGFDIAHDLPTKYTDFVDFLGDDYKKSETYKLLSSIGNENTLQWFIDRRSEILSILGADNQLLDFIKTQLEEHRKNKENWVDFEQEIAHVVKYAEKKLSENLDDNITSFPSIHFDFDFSAVPTDPVKLHEDFYRLLCSFEVYIGKIVNRIPIRVYSSDIQAIRPDIVISLNYSDTYARHYSAFRRIDYIHGKAAGLDYYENCRKKGRDVTSEVFRDSSHIVIGMDEYLSEYAIKNRTEFIGFRKYYQRISKRTGCKYRDNLNADKLNVFVFGHSIDPTDAELLKETVGNPNSKTTIFYHDENAYHRAITNLVRIFGKEDVIKRCDGSNPSIMLKKQREMVSIDGGGNYCFLNAVESLNHFTEISGSDFESAYGRVVAGLSSSGRDVETQEDVLRAYDALYHLGIETEYVDELLSIIAERPAIDDSGDLVNVKWVNPDDWVEGTVDGKLEVPPKMMDFINKVNEINRDKIRREGRKLIDDKGYIHSYEKEIPLEISQEDYKRFLIQIMKQLKDTKEPRRVWKLLKMVTISNSTVGAQVELSGLSRDKDEYTRAVAKVLLDYLANYEEEVAYTEWLNIQTGSDEVN